MVRWLVTCATEVGEFNIYASSISGCLQVNIYISLPPLKVDFRAAGEEGQLSGEFGGLRHVG